MTPAVPPASFEAVILAGGRGSRLGGADKPGLTIGTTTLAAAVVTAAVAAGARRVILVGPARPELAPLAASLPGGLLVVREEPPGSGPIPALRRGLASAGQPWTAVLAADLPFLRGHHLQALLQAAAPSPAGAVLTDSGSRPQWLAGCWRTGRLRSALLAYSGASLHGLMLPLQPVLLNFDDGGGEPPPWLDCDTFADLDRARQLLPRPGPQPGGIS
jgi:molybdopterin-guanine dinucleotide biosynthesis protein A